ncbi:hypothetical protein PGT21_029671 [Puccinia graminis f. sp. tritici]|uniref:Uncharacterized protein n=1 Tax=Puccinia graminis f. sp. tritici TaxID=56615 RepID=A0A5B0QQ65_PUCGR|nr:hypothetical protein PGT21_029671 [Puccinia graminis f. sp. tritici]
MRSNHQPGSHNSMILDNRLTWLRSWLSPLTAIREFESLPQIPHEFLAQTSANQKTKKAAYLGFAAAQASKQPNFTILQESWQENIDHLSARLNNLTQLIDY